jgi:hypothetical protein
MERAVDVSINRMGSAARLSNAGTTNAKTKPTRLPRSNRPGGFKGCNGVVESAVFQRIVDYSEEFASGYHVGLLGGRVVTVVLSLPNRIVLSHTPAPTRHPHLQSNCYTRLYILIVNEANGLGFGLLGASDFVHCGPHGLPYCQPADFVANGPPSSSGRRSTPTKLKQALQKECLF